MNKTDQIASKFLGKKVESSLNYDPSLLVSVPRFENRKQYSISEDNLPFEGYDIWHAYEFSCMTENGIPITRLMKLRYNCNSKFIIESKSLKLYLNSFNMSKFGKDIKDCLEICKNKIEKDLSNKLETTVNINFIENDTEKTTIFNNYENIINNIDETKIRVEKFKESPELLEVEQQITKKIHKHTFDSLRSNCRVTHQPDFGDIFIYYNSKKHIKEDSLLKYLCSFRSEYHFHEECVEMIFKRLYDLLQPDDELMVAALYTRRGGIDICPCRWTPNLKLEDTNELINIYKFARKSIKQ